MKLGKLSAISCQLSALIVDELAELIPGLLKVSLRDVQEPRPAGLTPMKLEV